MGFRQYERNQIPYNEPGETRIDPRQYPQPSTAPAVYSERKGSDLNKSDTNHRVARLRNGESDHRVCLADAIRQESERCEYVEQLEIRKLN